MGQKKEIQCLAFATLIFMLQSLIGCVGYQTSDSTLAWLAAVSWVVLIFPMLMLCHIWWQSPADSHTYASLFKQYATFTLLKFKGRQCLNMLTDDSKMVSTQQERILKGIMTRQKRTSYGMKYGFTEIVTRAELRRRLPLTTYADYEADIERMTQGEENLLCCDKVVYYATSSGTTGKNKKLPVTTLMKDTYQMRVGSLMYYLLHKKSGLHLGRNFAISYRPKVEEMPCGLLCGPITFHMSRHVPWNTAPAPVLQIEDEQAALYVHAVFALQEPEVTQVEPLMATVMYSFWCLVQARWKDICDDIEQGNIRELPNLSATLRDEINKHMEPDPECSEFLRKQFSKGFNGIALRVWPKCRFVRMLTTGGFAHYAQMLRDVYMSGITQISQTHAASEGFYGVSVDYESSETTYVPMQMFGVFEFISEETIDESQPETYFLEQQEHPTAVILIKISYLREMGVVISRGALGPEGYHYNPSRELEEGRTYEMVLTSPMGMYRYRTGDVIKVTGFFNQCPMYMFHHRSGQILNLYWEKTTEVSFYKSLCQAADELDVTVIDYTATESIHLKDHPEFKSSADEPKHYVLFVELEQDGSPVTLDEDEKSVFDECLRRNGELYSTLREKNSIGEMKVIQVQKGTFPDVRGLLLAEAQNYQVKMPRAMRRKDILDFLLQRRLK